MRLATSVVVLILCTSASAVAQARGGVTQSSIAGIRLGASQANARALMTRPVHLDRLEDGYIRLVSPRQNLESYFRTGT